MKKIIMVIVVILLILVGILIDIYSNVPTATITAVIAVIVVGMQLYRNDRLKEADFIVKFNFGFINAPNLISVLKNCEDNNGKSLKLTDVVSYLSYFEALSFMLENNAISKDNLYSLIQHRLFVVLNNPDVQDLIIHRKPSFDKLIDMCDILSIHRKKLEKKKNIPSSKNWFNEKNIDSFISSYKYGKK